MKIYIFEEKGEEVFLRNILYTSGALQKKRLLPDLMTLK